MDVGRASFSSHAQRLSRRTGLKAGHSSTRPPRRRLCSRTPPDSLAVGCSSSRGWSRERRSRRRRFGRCVVSSQPLGKLTMSAQRTVKRWHPPCWVAIEGTANRRGQAAAFSTEYGVRGFVPGLPQLTSLAVHRRVQRRLDPGLLQRSDARRSRLLLDTSRSERQRREQANPSHQL